MPGPACYNRGGTEPTVTDANVVLGVPHPDALAGGTVPIDAGRARAAVQKIGASAGDRSARRGSRHSSPRQRVDDAGGEGGVDLSRSRSARVQAVRLRWQRARVLAAMAAGAEIRRVLIPPGAGVFSAIGLLAADLEAVRSSAFLRPLDAGRSRLYRKSYAGIAAAAGGRGTGCDRTGHRAPSGGAAL